MGDFETHFTVVYDDRLPEWADRLGLKYTRIRLDRGACADQPMLTSTGRGDLPEQRAAAGALVALLQRDGFTVRRVKIEAAPWHACVPVEPGPTGGCYFEHHVKLVLADGQLDLVRSVAEGHGAHLSRNARRVRDDGRHERFVTQRCRDVGRPQARERLDALLSALAGAGLDAVEVEEEYVVVDDNPGLDAGWIR
ncbi:hypothetical protein AB0K00_04525 [Dactylosporangium sp. NPDC049525]|uniref:hypothetical protein n=1 Tax=Dactylosporangium sp. NPDC049525 TaxID=3154730 RepID=UPI00343730BA